MASKGPRLEKRTLDLVKRMLSMPPKPHDEMKVGRPKKKKRDLKGRAVSAKRRTA